MENGKAVWPTEEAREDVLPANWDPETQRNSRQSMKQEETVKLQTGNELTLRVAPTESELGLK